MESIFYFIRHDVHGIEGMPNQALTPSAREHSIGTGRKLAEIGVQKFDYTACSWQPRAVETLLCVMQGMGTLTPIQTSEAIGDAVSGHHRFSPEEIAGLKTEAAAAGIDTESYLLASEKFADRMGDRGIEGADYILKQIGLHAGKVGAGASHGGSRMEVTVMELMRRSPHFETLTEPPFLFTKGGVAELRFDENGDLVKVSNYGDFFNEPLVLEGTN